MPYNDENWKHYPYYIKRDCATDRKSYSIKLSKPIRNELDAFFDAKYGKGNRQQGLHDMVMEYLNTKSLERKYFNFEYIILLNDNQDITYENMLQFEFIDHCKLAKAYEKCHNLEITDISLANDHLFDFLITPKEKNGMLNFDFSTSNLSDKPDEFSKSIDKWKKSDDTPIYEINFFLNNYLDHKSDGEYVGDDVYFLNQSNKGYGLIHKGIGGFKDVNDVYYYFTYKWSIRKITRNMNNVYLFDFKLHDAGDINVIVAKSDNKILHRYFGMNDSYEFAEDIDAQIENIKNKIETWQEHLQFLKDKKVEQRKEN